MLLVWGRIGSGGLRGLQTRWGALSVFGGFDSHPLPPCIFLYLLQRFHTITPQPCIPTRISKGNSILTVFKLGKKIVARWRSKFKINNMGNKKQYDPDVYKRLELVTRQFQNQASVQKKLRKAESRQQFLDYLIQHKIKIVRLMLYSVLSLLVIAVIVVSILR